MQSPFLLIAAHVNANPHSSDDTKSFLYALLTVAQASWVNDAENPTWNGSPVDVAVNYLCQLGVDPSSQMPWIHPPSLCGPRTMTITNMEPLIVAAEAFGAKSSMQVAWSIRLAVENRPKTQSKDDAIREALESVKDCRPELFSVRKKPKAKLEYIDR